MKKIANNFIYPALFSLTLITACNSLDQYPTDSFTDKEYWTTTERAEMIMNKAYRQMYGADQLWTDEALSDNLVNMRGAPDVTVIRRSQANASTPLFDTVWTRVYRGVNTVNVFLGNVNLVPGMDAGLKERMSAEVRFIRAYLFFRLSNFYGDIPFFLKEISLAESKTITRTKRADVLRQLHEELDDIIPILPKKEDLTIGERGRITKAAAVMLKARIYLMQNDMVNVEKYCGYLIDNQGEYGGYSLFDTATDDFTAYENLFRSAYEYNDEVILDYSYIPQDIVWDYFIDMVPPSVAGYRVCGNTPTQSLVDSYIMLSSGLPVQNAYTKPVPYASDPSYNDSPTTMANGRDKRLAATVAYHGSVWKDKSASGAPVSHTLTIAPGSTSEDVHGGENKSQTGYYVRKLFDVDHGTDLKMHNNIIMMRYADVLLMYAEACERNGRFDQAVWDKTIRPIRERAGFESAASLDYPAAYTSNMREIIRRERRCELALEGLRYYDLVRWGRDPEGAYNLLDGQVYGAKFASSMTDYLKVEVFKYRENRDEWWSLPQNDITASPSILPNNPGY